MSEKQRSFEFRTWGGKRRGAGRAPQGDGDAQPHVAREAFSRPMPVHVTLRFVDHVWNLRSERSFVVIHRALEAARRRADARVVHFSVLGDHLHLICEAASSEALSNALRALEIRLARGLNRMMGRSGPVFADRYDAHVLRTPAEVRNALRYVVGNFASHARRRREPMRAGWIDPFSSAVVKVPLAPQRVLFAEAVTRGPETWLLWKAGEDAPTCAREPPANAPRGGPSVRRFG